MFFNCPISYFVHADPSCIARLPTTHIHDNRWDKAVAKHESFVPTHSKDTRVGRRHSRCLLSLIPSAHTPRAAAAITRCIRSAEIYDADYTLPPDTTRKPAGVMKTRFNDLAVNLSRDA